MIFGVKFDFWWKKSVKTFLLLAYTLLLYFGNRYRIVILPVDTSYLSGFQCLNISEGRKSFVIGNEIIALHFCTNYVLHVIFHVGIWKKQRFLNILFTKVNYREFGKKITNGFLDFIICEPLLKKCYKLSNSQGWNEKPFSFKRNLLFQLAKNQQDALKKLLICCYIVIFSGLMFNTSRILFCNGVSSGYMLVVSSSPIFSSHLLMLLSSAVKSLKESCVLLRTSYAVQVFVL